MVSETVSYLEAKSETFGSSFYLGNVRGSYFISLFHYGITMAEGFLPLELGNIDVILDMPWLDSWATCQLIGID